jgi:hypothetical protein
MANGSLSSILDTLPPLMNALRMVWIISRHYSDDVRMGNLFERIANEVRERNGASDKKAASSCWPYKCSPIKP